MTPFGITINFLFSCWFELPNSSSKNIFDTKTTLSEACKESCSILCSIFLFIVLLTSFPILPCRTKISFAALIENIFFNENKSGRELLLLAMIALYFLLGTKRYLCIFFRDAYSTSKSPESPSLSVRLNSEGPSVSLISPPTKSILYFTWLCHWLMRLLFLMEP